MFTQDSWKVINRVYIPSLCPDPDDVVVSGAAASSRLYPPEVSQALFDPITGYLCTFQLVRPSYLYFNEYDYNTSATVLTDVINESQAPLYAIAKVGSNFRYSIDSGGLVIKEHTPGLTDNTVLDWGSSSFANNFTLAYSDQFNVLIVDRNTVDKSNTGVYLVDVADFSNNVFLVKETDFVYYETSPTLYWIPDNLKSAMMHNKILVYQFFEKPYATRFFDQYIPAVHNTLTFREDKIDLYIATAIYEVNPTTGAITVIQYPTQTLVKHDAALRVYQTDAGHTIYSGQFFIPSYVYYRISLTSLNYTNNDFNMLLDISLLNVDLVTRDNTTFATFNVIGHTYTEQGTKGYTFSITANPPFRSTPLDVGNILFDYLFYPNIDSLHNINIPDVDHLLGYDSRCNTVYAEGDSTTKLYKLIDRVGNPVFMMNISVASALSAKKIMVSYQRLANASYIYLWDENNIGHYMTLYSPP